MTTQTDIVKVYLGESKFSYNFLSLFIQTDEQTEKRQILILNSQYFYCKLLNSAFMLFNIAYGGEGGRTKPPP